MSAKNRQEPALVLDPMRTAQVKGGKMLTEITVIKGRKKLMC